MLRRESGLGGRATAPTPRAARRPRRAAAGDRRRRAAGRRLPRRHDRGPGGRASAPPTTSGSPTLTGELRDRLRAPPDGPPGRGHRTGGGQRRHVAGLRRRRRQPADRREPRRRPAADRQLPLADLLADPVQRRPRRRVRQPGHRLPARLRRAADRPGRRAASRPSSSSAPRPTTHCCSSRATARSCARTRTATSPCASRCAPPARRSWPAPPTVAAALLTLLLCDVGLTRSIGPLAATGVLASMLLTLTLLPALLLVAGRRAFWPLIPRVGTPPPQPSAACGAAIGRRIARRPRPVWVAGLAVLAVMALGTHASSRPPSGPAASSSTSPSRSPAPSCSRAPARRRRRRRPT